MFRHFCLPQWLRPWLPFIFILLCCQTIALLRLHSYGEPLDIDVSQYSVIGHEWLHGKRLYTDLFDQKPPLIYATYAAAQLLAGYGFGSVYLLGVLAAVVTLLGVYVAASAGAGNRMAGYWAAGFWTVISGDCMSFVTRPYAETFISPIFIWAVALLIRANAKGERVHPLGPGILLCLATLYKHNMVLVIAVLAAGHIFWWSGRETRRRAFQDVLIWGLVGVTVWGAIAGYFFVRGRFGDFYEALFSYNRYYAGLSWQGTPAHLLKTKLLSMIWPAGPMRFVAPLFCLTIAGLGFGNHRRRIWRPLLGLFAGYILTIVVTGHYDQYDVVFMAVAAAGAGLGIAAIHTRLPGWTASGLGVICLIFLGGYELHYYNIPGEQWAYTRLNEVVFNQALVVSKQIDQLLEPDETFYIFGDVTSPYIYTQRRLPTRYHWSSCYVNTILSNKAPAVVIEDLQRVQPPLAVICRWGAPETTNNVVYRWVRANYRPLPMDPKMMTYQLRVLPGSRLEQQIFGNGQQSHAPAEKSR